MSTETITQASTHGHQAPHSQNRGTLDVERKISDDEVTTGTQRDVPFCVRRHLPLHDISSVVYRQYDVVHTNLNSAVQNSSPSQIQVIMASSVDNSRQ
jgi:hypothetical protein